MSQSFTNLQQILADAPVKINIVQLKQAYKEKFSSPLNIDLLPNQEKIDLIEITIRTNQLELAQKVFNTLPKKSSKQKPLTKKLSEKKEIFSLLIRATTNASAVSLIKLSKSLSAYENSKNTTRALKQEFQPLLYNYLADIFSTNSSASPSNYKQAYKYAKLAQDLHMPVDPVTIQRIKANITAKLDTQDFNKDFSALIDTISITESTSKNVEAVHQYRNNINQYNNSGEIKASLYAYGVDNCMELFGVSDSDSARKLIALLISSKIQIKNLPETILDLAKAEDSREQLAIIDQFDDQILNSAITQLKSDKNLHSLFSNLHDWQIQEVRATLAALMTKSDIAADLLDAISSSSDSARKIIKIIEKHSIITPIKYNKNEGVFEIVSGSSGDFDGLIWDKDNNLVPIMATTDNTAKIEGDSLLRHSISAIVIQSLLFDGERKLKKDNLVQLCTTLSIHPPKLESVIKHLNASPNEAIQIINQIDGNKELSTLIIDPNLKVVLNDITYQGLEERMNGYFYGAVSCSNPDKKGNVLNTTAINESIIFYMTAHAYNQNNEYLSDWAEIEFPQAKSMQSLLLESFKDSFDVRLSNASRNAVEMDDTQMFLESPNQFLAALVMSDPKPYTNGSSKKSPNQENSKSKVFHDNVTSSLQGMLDHYRGNEDEFALDFDPSTINDLYQAAITYWPLFPKNNHPQKYLTGMDTAEIKGLLTAAQSMRDINQHDAAIALFNQVIDKSNVESPSKTMINIRSLAQNSIRRYGTEEADQQLKN